MCRGKFARVFKCQDDNDKKYYAMKIVNKNSKLGKADDEMSKKMFENEIAILN